MKVLLVYPEFPETFWSFRRALKFISKKAVQPPLGLITVAAMLPEKWEKKLVDMNISKLRDKDITWADYVMISAMTVQNKSVENIIFRCHEANTRIIAGGPLFSSDWEKYRDIDHLILNEAELTLPPFLEDLEKKQAKHIYQSSEFPSIKDTPVPMWELVDINKYATLNLQYSRGCPFDCEFCDITVLNGRKSRTKTAEQVIAELEAIRKLGWNGDVSFVDDNFIGNKNNLKKDILPAIYEWSKKTGGVFCYSTEASINLSDDTELMKMMVDSGFDSVFVGIETVSDESLEECNKQQNRNRDILESVRKIQHSGLLVTAGFILGFDNDRPEIFENMVNFIQHSGIVCSMVGLLNAPRHTRLHKRMLEEERMLRETTGNNTDFSLNFLPKMDIHQLIRGYRRVIDYAYSISPFYKRLKTLLQEYKAGKPAFKRKFKYPALKVVFALFKSMFLLGIVGNERFHYWRLFYWTLFKKPRLFPLAITYAVYGYHFRRYFKTGLFPKRIWEESMSMMPK